MKAPNVVSIVAMLVVVLPGFILAIEKQFPPEAYWWSVLITGGITALIKALEVWRTPKTTAPSGPELASMDVRKPEPVRSWFLG